MKELFSIGPIHIYFFGLMIGIGIISGMCFAINIAKSRGISEDTIINLTFTIAIAGIIGARVFYVLFYNPSYYLNHPSELLRINEGGLSIHGGIFLAALAGILFSIKNKISFFKLADVSAIGIALAQGIGRVGCDVFGKVMINVMPWGVNVGGQVLHPTQVYEFVLDYILFTWLWRKSENQRYEGELFVTYIIAFPVIRGIVEFFRINPKIWGMFSISYGLSLLFIIAGIILYILIRNKNKTSIYQNQKPVKSINRIIWLAGLMSVSLLIYYLVQG